MSRQVVTIECECGWRRQTFSFTLAVTKWKAHLKAGVCADYYNEHGQLNLLGERKKRMIDRKRYAGESILRSTDLKDGQTYVIDWFKEITTALRDKPVQPAIHLNGFDKYLPLNVTNLDTLLDAFSSDEEKWKGQKIRIRIVPTTTPGGNPADGVRIEIPKGK